jgi:sugar/nucleoside kinase (ribokinase family)
MIDKKAIIAGLICLDMIPDLSSVPEGQFAHLFQPGQLVHTNGVRLSPGGSVPNTGLALHRLGVPVRLIGKIGNDLFGQALQGLLRDEAPHLADDLVIDLTLPTSFTVVIDPPGSDRSFLHHPGANATFYASDLPRDSLEKADLFHFGYPTLMRSVYRAEGAELVSILQRARRAGLTTALDFSLPDPNSPAGQADWQAILANVLPLVDLFVPSVEELAFLLDQPTYDRLNAGQQAPFIENFDPQWLSALAEQALGYGIKAVLVKCGARGVYLRTAPGHQWEKGGRALAGLDDLWHNRQLWAPAFQVNVLGITGAGDVANAGFLASLLRGADPLTAVTMAVAAGAVSVETADVTSGLQSWEALNARVARGWPFSPLELSPYGWHWLQTHGVWER